MLELVLEKVVMVSMCRKCQSTCKDLVEIVAVNNKNVIK